MTSEALGYAQLYTERWEASERNTLTILRDGGFVPRQHVKSRSIALTPSLIKRVGAFAEDNEISFSAASRLLLKKQLDWVRFDTWRRKKGGRRRGKSRKEPDSMDYMFADLGEAIARERRREDRELAEDHRI